uniref:Chemokine interleukin-8-like domain-containing protein n=1 Tax=Lates calcarifer TaxID=8187 RepID=A0A4W6ESS5_LATCA
EILHSVTDLLKMRSSLGLACLPHGPMLSCCLRWSKTIVPLNRIKHYIIQTEGICPRNAVVFLTQSGLRLCADPGSDWAKRAMQKLNEKARALLKVKQNEQESTGGITAAMSTTPKMESHHEQALGDSGKEKPPFKRQKHRFHVKNVK